MQNDSDFETRKKLSELCSDCIILILQLRSSKEFGDAKTLRSKLVDVLDRFDKDAHISGYKNEKIQAAKFALAAFIDETIIGSEWSKKEDWLSEPLQLKLFDTFNAGEEFFTKLDALREKGKENRDVIEIFYLCLTLGFRGKYQIHAPEQVRNIIESLFQDLYHLGGKNPGLLSPNGKPHDELVNIVKERIPAWVFAVVCAAIGICFYIIMSFLISEEAADSVSKIQNLL